MNRTEMDYYAVLNVPRSATKEEITLAYRKLAIRLNPNRDAKHDREFVPNMGLTHMTPLPENRQWEYINMAYDVLGNELRRAIYDRFGEAALFQGILLPNGYFPPYQYHGDDMAVYNQIFGSYSPYANVIDVVTNPPLLYSSKEHGIGVRTQDAPVERIIYLDLSEIRFGSTKLMHVWRQEFVDELETRTEKRKKALTLRIEPGTTPGTRYTFKQEGDRCPTKIPADIIFITADKPHPVFKRRNHHDLVYRHKINLCQALTGFSFNIETLDKRTLKIPITDVVSPSYTKIMPREGLPKCKIIPLAPDMKPRRMKREEFGDLIIEFEITFPTVMNRKMRTLTRDFFAELKEMEEIHLAEPNPIQKLLNKQNC